MNLLHVITTVNAEVTTLLTTIKTQKSESRLFVFSNGLDEVYDPL